MKKQLLLFSIIVFLKIHILSAQQALVPAWTLESNISNGYMGRYLGETGDLNGDGYKDIYTKSNGQVNIYYGSVSGFNTTPNLILKEPGITYSSISHGDLNHDKKDDVVIGDEIKNNFMVFYGKTGGINATTREFAFKNYDK